ncbi:MAG: creatininase family protein [Chloroflexi bacterium]|nr:creatininase family protein [Chloroflexota bacterium]
MAKGAYYDRNTWPEAGELAQENRIVVLPVGAVEQHGMHLPLNTDNVLVWSVCETALKIAPGEILLLPVVPYGFCETMMDFPGTITIEPSHLTEYVLDIVKSVGHHGFRKAVIVNGHGSNRAILEVVARRAVIEGDVMCAVLSYWDLIRAEMAELRESEPGGIAHACEMETSMYLHLDQDAVQMDKAVKDIGYPPTEFFSIDFAKGGAAGFSPYWSTFSKTGTLGDPTQASSDKGEKFLVAAATGLLELIREFRRRPIDPRVDHH